MKYIPLQRLHILERMWKCQVNFKTNHIIVFGIFTYKFLTCRICVWLSTTLSSTFINLLSLSTFFYKVTNSFMIWLPSTCLLSAKNEGSVFGGNMIYFDLFSQNLSTAAHSVTIAITYHLCNPQMNQHNLVYVRWAEIQTLQEPKNLECFWLLSSGTNKTSLD